VVPEKIVSLSWSEAVRLCYGLAVRVHESRYVPDAIVAVLRGGVLPALIISDVLGVDEFYAVRARHWGIGEELYPEPIIEQLPQGRGEGRRLLVVDEVADTGKTLAAVVRELRRAGAAEVRSAVLHVKPTATHEPDYYAVRLREWAWVFYPWSLIETIYSLARAEEGDLLERAESIAKTITKERLLPEVLAAGVTNYSRRGRT